MTMGHEVCGIVAELGEGVDGAWRGARVAVETFFSTCGVCRYCRAGKLSVCAQRRSIGTHVDGGFAPRLVLPARNLHRVPDALPDEAAGRAMALLSSAWLSCILFLSLLYRGWCRTHRPWQIIGILSSFAEHPIVPCTAKHDIVPGTRVDHIAAASSINLLTLRGATQLVIAQPA